VLTMPTMQLTEINGVKLELFDGGNQDGEPVMLIHGGGCHEWHGVLQEPSLLGDYRVIYLHRRGNGNSELPEPTTSVRQQAGDFRATLQSLGLDRAHIVGHSLGGAIALQYALDYPETVRSITLGEPAIPTVFAESAEWGALMETVCSHYEAGDIPAAVDAFMKGVAGPDYRSNWDKTLPAGWFELMLGSTKTLFEVEAPALQSWSFTREDAARIDQPVLCYTGAESPAILRATHDTLRSWIPHSESVVVPGVMHDVPEAKPQALAEILTDFISRHPIPVQTRSS
jgi:pimeloyl-ACP methyl ester carboxylesterase